MFAHNIKEGFLAGYDHGKKAGTMHVGNHHIVKGAKLWEWGPGAYGTMWDSEVLTDKDGPYAELMTGAYSDNQPDYSWLKPYEYKSFQQYWYPLREMGGAVTANLNASLNFKNLEDSQYFIAANATQEFKNANILLKKGKNVIYESRIDLSPDKPFSVTIELDELKQEECTLILNDHLGNELVKYHPRAKEKNLDLPDPVSPPKSPEEIKSLEELYLTGLRIKQFHNARISPIPYFQELLKRDSLDVRTNTIMGTILKENFKLEEAVRYFRTALKRLTANYTRPRDCEAFYHLGVVLQQQGKLEAAYDTLYRAAWDQNYASASYFHLSQISVSRKNYELALIEINRSIANNSSNLSSLNLKTSILRMLGYIEEAKEQVEEVLNKDALSFYAIHEGILLANTEVNELNKHILESPESYIELAVHYLNSGLLDEARSILELAANSNVQEIKNYPSSHYYLGYILNKLGKKNDAEYQFWLGNKLSTDYCFPFRFESIDVFKTALNFNPADSRALYYLGNVLYDHSPDEVFLIVDGLPPGTTIEIDPVIHNMTITLQILVEPLEEKCRRSKPPYK